MNKTIYINIKSINDTEWVSFKIKKGLLAIVYNRIKEELPHISSTNWGGVVYENYFTNRQDLEIPLFTYVAHTIVEDAESTAEDNCFNYILYPDKMKVEEQVLTNIKSQVQSISKANQFNKQIKKYANYTTQQ
jgi:hypothetical protein